MMKRTRATFKLALRSCRRNEEQLRCDALANSYLKNTDQFWKKVKLSTNGRMTKYSCVVGDATNDVSIVKLWTDHYAKLYSQHNNENIVNETAKYALDNDYAITVADVRCSIDNMKSGKSCGPDVRSIMCHNNAVVRYVQRVQY